MSNFPFPVSVGQQSSLGNLFLPDGQQTRSSEQTGVYVREILESATKPDAHKKRTVVVMPAYNAASTLEKTIHDLPTSHVDEIILVDDCSTDNTVQVARGLGLRVFRHSKNRGYGANQKTCYMRAMERGADFIVMVHPDYQYDSRLVTPMIQLLEHDICDVVLGSRIRSRKETLAGGMPVYKYVANRILTTIENAALGQNLGDFHSGYRAYRREVLQKIPFMRNSDDFVFDSQFLAQVSHFDFRLGDIPVPVRYFDEASSINLKRSVQYGCATLGVLASFWANRLGVKKSSLFEED